MEWTDLLALVGLICLAGFIFYRAFRKKKWCPAIFGSDEKDSEE
jgi:LPXTG-motif cell wall-anchored protein